MSDPIVSRSADVMGGTVVFAGTRVPVQTLLDYLEAGETIDYLEAGETIDDFLDGFPSVTKQQAIAFLEEAKNRVIEATPSRFCLTNVSIGAWHATSWATRSRPLIR